MSPATSHCLSVLPWRGWPRRQGFWRRIVGTVTAGRGLGLHPAPYPHNALQGAARSAAPFSVASDLSPIQSPASKTQSGPRAERTTGLFKEARSLKKNLCFKECAAPAALSLKERDSLKDRASNPLKTELSLKGRGGAPCIPGQSTPFKRTAPLAGASRSHSITPVNQEGGLCNTPLYNYWNVGERNDL